MKKKSISSYKNKLWTIFSLYIRLRDRYTCFTCGRKGEGSGIHAGHFINKSIGGIGLYFHEDNVHAQCYNCNINLGGNQYIYGEKLGKDMVEKLRKIQQEYNKWDESIYIQKIEYYTEKVKELESNR